MIGIVPDKVALLTGASAGIGYAVANWMVGSGYRVILCSRAPIAAAKRLGPPEQVIPVAADICDPATADRLMSVASELGRLDAVLLNHGSPRHYPFVDASDAEWDYHFRLMVLAPLRILRAAVPLFRKSGGGRVVAVTSSAAKAPHAGIIFSASLRAALVNALKTAAVELGPDNILCNAVAPGAIDVPATRERWNRYYAERDGVTPEEVNRAALSRIPLARYGKPQDIAELIGFLLSDRNGFLTGQHIIADGGAVVAN